MHQKRYLNKKKAAEEMEQQYQNTSAVDYSLKEGETLVLQLKNVNILLLLSVTQKEPFLKFYRSLLEFILVKYTKEDNTWFLNLTWSILHALNIQHVTGTKFNGMVLFWLFSCSVVSFYLWFGVYLDS